MRNSLLSHANIVDYDQSPHFTASDLGLHYLPMSLLWGTGGITYSVHVTYQFDPIMRMYTLYRKANTISIVATRSVVKLQNGVFSS